MAVPTVTEVLCILVDHDFQHTIGGLFVVEVRSDGITAHLQDKIKEKKQNDLARVDADHLEVWRLRNPRQETELEQPGYLPNLRRLDAPGNGDEGDNESAWWVRGSNEILVHFSGLPKNRISALVRVPQIGGSSGDVGHDNSVLNSELVKDYEDIFINVHEWGIFQKSDIDLNNILEASNEIPTPDFVTNFERMLDRKPGLRPEVPCYLDSQSRAAYFELREDSTVEDESHEETQQPLRYVERLEALHIGQLVSYEWQKLWQGQGDIKYTLKGCEANGLFFIHFFVQTHGTTTVNRDKTPWPIRLITKCEAVQQDEQIRQYKPRSDFLISKSNLPRLLVEVNSTSTKSWPRDLMRMLLMGAAVVRFANKFLNAFQNEQNFVLCALFIHEDGEVIRYTLFQEQNNPAVRYRRKQFWLNGPDGRVEFARQLYNLLHLEVEGDEERNTIAQTDQLNKEISSLKLKSFHTKNKDGTQGTKQKRRRTDDGASADGSRGGGGQGAADSAELGAHGYEVQSQVTVDDNGGTWEPLFEMPPHIHIVYRPSEPSKKLIAKKVRKESNELFILKRLNTIQPRSEHVISLLDSFRGQSGPWVILPRMDRVTVCIVIAPKLLESKVTQVCWGLIKGLAYLHELCIAHRDIKPDNLVVDEDFCLKIIDFDIAIQLKDEDEEVDDECGTKYWIAPEVGIKSSMYSPIRADRWSCGRVLLYLLDKFKTDDERLRAVGRKLKVHNPKQRPSLLEWHSWLSVPLLNTDNIERKASRPRQDSMVVNGGDTTAPNAKKQRLAALDEDDTVRQFSALDEPQASPPVLRVH